jgi:hypothetical protein
VPWIGIEKDSGLFYEGAFRYGHGVLPVPVTAPAAVLPEDEFPPKLPRSYELEQAELLFREDSFDPVTRIRRGRLYVASQTRPEEWEVFPHPYRPTEANEAKVQRGTVTRRLMTFQPFHLPGRIDEINSTGVRPLIAVGTQTSFSIWNLVSMEGSSTGEFLITLRGRESFGALPELRAKEIPDACRQSVQEALVKLRDDVFRAGPASVVDRARDAAAAILSGYLQNLRVIGPGKDLFDLVAKLKSFNEPEKKRIAVAAAEIIRILHSRAKPSVQERLSVPPVGEHDAELAISCVAAILCEVGWAEWP